MRLMLRNVLLGSALVCLTGFGAHASCGGRDLWPSAPANVSPAAASPFDEGRLFTIQGAGRQVSYLMPTLHAPDPRVARLSTAQREALERSGVAIVEAIGIEARKSSARGGLPAYAQAGAGKTPADVLSINELDSLRRALRRASHSAAIANTAKPVAVAMLLDLPLCARASEDGALYLDQLVIRAARARNLPLVGLETVEEQVSRFDDLGQEDAAALLRAALQQASHAEDLLETTIGRFLVADLRAVRDLVQPADTLAALKARYPDRFIQKLIDERTATMFARAQPYLQEGGAFIAVGAAHVSGADGFAAIATRAGYSVVRVD